MHTPTFLQNLILQDVFETTAQINEKIKRAEFDNAFCENFKRRDFHTIFSNFFRCYDLIPSHGKVYIFRKL